MDSNQQLHAEFLSVEVYDKGVSATGSGAAA